MRFVFGLSFGFGHVLDLFAEHAAQLALDIPHISLRFFFGLLRLHLFGGRLSRGMRGYGENHGCANRISLQLAHLGRQLFDLIPILRGDLCKGLMIQLVESQRFDQAELEIRDLFHSVAGIAAVVHVGGEQQRIELAGGFVFADGGHSHQIALAGK
ncbi:MAG: hypothetical protein BWY83_03132 [bacterium ADurb.Bin478]|nr:MAG: hypothetical protein BWY83_03132 [bacterium ADurb.Bin478]